ncbi:MAG: hypothetical protein NVS9B10_23630 [Nevskia sp.]
MSGRWASVRRPSVPLAAALLLLLPALAQAHPLGQNAFNREAAILVQPDRVQINYLLDLAEVPTLSFGEQADTDRDGTVTDAEWTGYAERWAKTLPLSLVVEIGNQPLALTLDSQTWRIAPGQAGLSTLRLLAHLHAPLAGAPGEHGARLDYRDQTQVNRLGWKEIWISAANGARIVSSDVPQQDRSKALTDFTPRAEGPPALLAAHAEFGLAGAGSVEASAAANPPALKPGACPRRAGSQRTGNAHALAPAASRRRPRRSPRPISRSMPAPAPRRPRRPGRARRSGRSSNSAFVILPAAGIT